MFVAHCEDCGSYSAKCPCSDEWEMVCNDCETELNYASVGEFWYCVNCVSSYVRQWSTAQPRKA